MPKLTSITVDANGVNIAGKQTYDFQNDKWGASITEGSSTITLNFAGGHALVAENSGVMAAMVCLPAKVSGKTLTVTYNFADGSKFTETKNPTKDLVSGATSRIKTQIEKKNLVKEPSYELRVLTFEDKDAKFSPYELDYVGANITTWSDLIDEPQYSGPLTYGNDATDAMYYWYDEGNTELYHMFPDNYGYYCFWGGGHAISNYWGAGYADEDRNNHIANYYGKDYVDQWAGKPGADAALGWFLLQLMAPIAPHSGDNFVVHYGYKDFFSYVENLPEISFFDGEPRVIDHMYVNNSTYAISCYMDGNGLTAEIGPDDWVKAVAIGYDADGNETGRAEIYLCNGPDNIVTDWTKWDLTSLGKVVKVDFNILGSSDNGYGFSQPAYFAYDNVAVRFDKK
jgi:hypothetical protein